MPASAEIRKQELEMAQLLNEDRSELGLAPLVYDARLAEVARHHSADMLQSGVFEHRSPSSGSPSDRLDRAEYLFLTVRENLSEELNIESSQQGLLESPHHYENIMAEDVSHIGIGIVPGGVHDPRSITVTQLFATPVTVRTATQATEHIAATFAQVRLTQGLSPCKADNRLTNAARAGLERFMDPAVERSLAELSQWLQAKLSSLSLAQLQISAELVPDSSFVTPPSLVEAARNCSTGLAVQTSRDPNGRPALQVLLVVAER